MDSKHLARVEIKDAAKGEVEAVFATLNVIDKDGDVTQKGAFTNGARVAISAYGHKVWDGAAPVGKGQIFEQGNEVVFKGQFFMNTTAGRDTFEVIKEMGEDQQWSYGFDVEDSAPGEHEGKSVRFLKRMKVHEVSPVMLGAGVNTRTVAAKSFKEEVSEAADAVRKAVEGAERVVALRAENGKNLSQLAANSLVGLREQMDKLDAILDSITKTGNDEDEDEDTDKMVQFELVLIEEELE